MIWSNRNYFVWKREDVVASIIQVADAFWIHLQQLMEVFAAANASGDQDGVTRC